MLQHGDNADERTQQKFVSGMSCASPVVVAPVASNIESFEQTHAPDAEAPSADMNMRPYTFPSF
jgi:hypothetical protein